MLESAKYNKIITSVKMLIQIQTVCKIWCLNVNFSSFLFCTFSFLRYSITVVVVSLELNSCLLAESFWSCIVISCWFLLRSFSDVSCWVLYDDVTIKGISNPRVHESISSQLGIDNPKIHIFIVASLIC
jgi:hypothetical protein